MTLLHILVFAIGAALAGLLIPKRWRLWALLGGSVLAIYWLQPSSPVRYLDFWLPTATLLLAALTWLVTVRLEPEAADAERAVGNRRQWMIAWGVIGALILGVAATRYLAEPLRLTSRPPDILGVVIALAVCTGLGLLAWRLRGRGALVGGVFALIVAIFIALKWEPLTAALDGLLLRLNGQDSSLARASDVVWLGFSYVAFRLLHTLRDRQTGKLPPVSLREYLLYVVFFPAYTAGPIDRVERFTADLREPFRLDAKAMTEGGRRIFTGLLKKFVIADSLALIALDPASAAQANPGAGAWILLYAYALYLWLDFSGYTDIAIGIGILAGIKLPENFDRPYLKTNLKSFWQSWHITLSSWLRFYVFSPLSRWLLMKRVSPNRAVFAAQMATMLLVGLWHGITLNFIIWGAWHGVGLFAHKVWSDRTRKRYRELRDRPRLQRLVSAGAWLITFHYIALGWVWFALPDPEAAVGFFGRLLGL
jgi:D-alanyl-lipoteichoic acid acyltransferase DltB (MBOAT superfamily)